MERSVIVGYVRSPFQPARRGLLARVRPDDLAARVIAELVDRTGVDPAAIEDVTLGCAFPEGEQGMNLGRIVGVLAGLPRSVGGSTVNRFCGSSMQAVHIAVGSIAMGAGDAFVCAGVESMSRIPMGGFNPLYNPKLVESYPEIYITMGETAENVADRFEVSRDEQEAFALQSQQKAAAALAAGRLAGEIVAIAGDRDRATAAFARIPASMAWPSSSRRSSPTARSPPAPPRRSQTELRRCWSPPRRTPAITDWSRWRQCGRSPSPAATRRSWALARWLPAARRWSGPESLSTTSAWSRSTRRSPPRRWPACASWGSTRAGSTWTAARSRWATRWVRPGRGSPARRPSCCAAKAARYALATQCIGGGQGIATVLEAV